MLPDVIAHDARTNGPGRGGSFSGMWTAGETTGLAFGTTLLAITLAATGYLESTPAAPVEAQAPMAILGIILSFSVLPAVLMAISFIPHVALPAAEGRHRRPRRHPVGDSRDACARRGVSSARQLCEECRA